MLMLAYECSLQPGRVVVQQLVGSVKESTRVHDGEVYVKVLRKDGAGTFELVVEKRHVYYMARAAIGVSPRLVGRKAALIEIEEEATA